MVNVFDTIKWYRKGMRLFDANHPQSFKNSLESFQDELREFAEEPSVEEFFDVVHTIGRMLQQITGIWVFCIAAWPTVKKHAMRTKVYGCPRSRRNCCGKCI